MKRKSLFCYALLVFMATSPLLQAEELFDLVNQRLHYMKSVAVYKAKQDLPVEDKAQEQKVLDRALAEAKTNGLDAESVAAFFNAQINVAKDIQTRYHQQWATQMDHQGMPLPDMMGSIRPELIRLGDEIVQQLSAYLVRYGSVMESQRHKFYAAMTTDSLTADDKKQLFDALLQVQKAK